MWVGECICESYWLVLFLWKLRVIVFRDLNLLGFVCKHQVSCYYVQLYEEFGLIATEDVSTALARGTGTIWDQHTQHYKSLYNQMQLSLGPITPEDGLSTDQRIRKPPTPSLIALYTNYARYLLISSSCGTGSTHDLPANLQGIWNSDLDPQWGKQRDERRPVYES